MYPRVKRVRRGERTYDYLQLVEGRREDGKVRQHVVATLGRVDEFKASGQLDRWAGAFARLDPPRRAPAARSARSCSSAATWRAWDWPASSTPPRRCADGRF
ncbi:MAG: hypothetical protein ACRD0K_07125 [Egibacteraceae bacterium]